MVTLEEVRDAFELWRVSRVHKGCCPLPESLWSMAREVVPHYERLEIQNTLKISKSQFTEHCLQPPTPDTQADTLREKGGFASGSVDPSYFEPPKAPREDPFKPSPEDTRHHDVCELRLQGAHKSLHIKASMTQLPHILSVMEGYL